MILKRIDDLEAMIQTKVNDPPLAALSNVLLSTSPSSSLHDIWAFGPAETMETIFYQH
jgi:hypothetical protein